MSLDLTYEYEVEDYIELLQEMVERHELLLDQIPKEDAEERMIFEQEVAILKELLKRIFNQLALSGYEKPVLH